MPQAAPAEAGAAPFAKGSIIWQRKGPLPVWAWVLLGLVLVVGFMYWRRARATGEAVEYTTGDNSLPGDQSAPPIFIVPQQPSPQVIVNNVPSTVPTAPPGGGSPPPTTPVPTSPGRYIPVVPYTKKNPPWNSTLSGIFAHLNGPSPTFKTTAANWQAIWNHPLNADLRRKRGQADRIQPGDQVFVPGKAK